MVDVEPVVELSGVWFGFPPQPAVEPALEDVSLRVAPRDFLGIIGPNGGGKTTLLKIVLGLLKPQRGTIRVLGGAPAQTRRQIGYVPQHGRIDASVPASVLDVVLTGRLSRSSWGPCYRRAQVDFAMEALRQTEMDDFCRRAIGTLSGGQRQRVLIARALASDTQLLLLDEPTAGVDPHMERGLIDLLHRLNERLPIVIVSHDVSFVSAHLKRVACLNRRLTCHAASEISWEAIGHIYHGPMRAVRHAQECPLSDPGCAQGCHEPGAEHGMAPGSQGEVR